MNVDGDADTQLKGLLHLCRVSRFMLRFTPKVGVPECICNAGKDAKSMAIDKTSKQHARDPLAVN